MLNDLLSPVETRLQQIEDGYHQGDLAHGVSSRESVGWPRVDEEIRALRERFQTASTTQDYRDVGNRCAAVLDALSATVYDPDLHLQDGETVPPVNKSKERIGRYIEHSLTGSENQKIRDLTRKVIELSHSIKHSPAPTRRYAGIAADSVILLTHILGRLDEDD